VLCLDGDGAALMHLGSLAVIGAQRSANFRHLLLNNGAHASVGGQPTVGFDTDFPAVALACGYRWGRRVSAAQALPGALAEWLAAPGPALLEVRVALGHRPELGRPSVSPLENKRALMDTLR